MKYTTLLFDADMTLFDFDTAELTAFGIVMNNNRIQYTNADFEAYKSINAKLWERFGRGEITKDFLQAERFTAFLKTLDNGYTESDGKRFNSEYVDALAECPMLLDGALELCRELSEKYDMYILTNGISRVQKKRFAASEISRYFKDIFVSEDAGAPKPMTAYFDYVFAHIGEDRRASSIMIGDSLSSDIAGGINAGIDTMLYLPHGDISKSDIVPLYTAKSYDDIRALLL
ncbi:MAG: noncanonical pyrimidine nucleotidase, YjjG family [Clostridiales bacterium]|nr:noncanonical pyrimidine nucleotidase, YjjG family [Clostridiales bacterium]